MINSTYSIGMIINMLEENFLLTFNLNDCFQNTYFLHSLFMQGINKGPRLTCKTMSMIHSSYITFIKFITMHYEVHDFY